MDGWVDRWMTEDQEMCQYRWRQYGELTDGRTFG